MLFTSIYIFFFNYLETYDIINTTAEITSSYVLLTTSFVNNSSARGVLYAFMYLNNGNIDFSKSRYLPVKKAEAELGINVTDVELIGGTYRILSYDIEKNFRIQGSGSPADVFCNDSTCNLASRFFILDVFICTYVLDTDGVRNLLPDSVNCNFMCLFTIFCHTGIS